MPDKETYLVEIVRVGKTNADGKVVRKEEMLAAPGFLRRSSGLTRELVLFEYRDVLKALTAKEIADEVVVNIARPFADE